MKKITLVFLFLISGFYLIGQQIANYNLPYEIKTAIKNGTRTYSGLPGPNYWQNNSKYDIDILLNVGENLLNALEFQS